MVFFVYVCMYVCLSSTCITLLSNMRSFVHVTPENIPIGMPQPSKTPNSDVIPSLLATRLGHPMVILSKAHMNERTNERTNTHGFLINNVVDQIQVREEIYLFVDMSMDCGLFE